MVLRNSGIPLFLALALIFGGIPPSLAQTAGSTAVVVNSCGTPPNPTYKAGQVRQSTQDTGGKDCVNATVSVSASISGFTAATVGTPINVTTSGVTGTLPAGTEVVATNVGTTNGAYCALGASTSNAWQYIAPNGGWFGFTVGASTQLTCLTSTSTTTVNMVGGAGLPTGTGGGGGSGGGSSGAVFGPTAVGSAAANPPVLQGGTIDGTATGNVAVQKIVSGVASVNTAQVNGVTTLAGAGATGTGAQRETVAQDTTTVAGASPTATGIYVTGASAAALMPATGGTVGLVAGSAIIGKTSQVDSAGNDATDTTNHAVKVNIVAGGGSGGTSVAQGSTTSGQNVSPAGCATVSSAPTNTNAQTNMVTCTVGGSENVNVTNNGVTAGTSTTGLNYSAIGAASATACNGGSDTTAQVNPVTLDLKRNVCTHDIGSGATGSAVPANAVYNGSQNSSGLSGMISCDSSVVYDASTNGSTQLVALTSGKTIYVCGYSLFAAGTVNVELDYGTGTACATGNNKIVPAFEFTAQTGIVDKSPYWSGLKTAASNELCLKTSGGVAVQAIVYYTQF